MHIIKMHQVCFLLVCLILFFEPTYSLENNGRGTKAIGMANAAVASTNNAWSVFYNPAGLSYINNFELSTFIVPNQFGINELQTASFVCVLPLNFISIGIKFDKFGFELYKETTVGVSLSKKIEEISIGASVNICNINIARYGSYNALSYDFGVITQIDKNINLGFNVTNFNKATIGKQKSELPQIVNFGMSWIVVEDFLITTEIEKDIRFPISLKCGVEQKLFNIISVRAGIANNPQKYSAGLSVKYLFIEFGYAGYNHLELGWTNQIDITFIY